PGSAPPVPISLPQRAAKSLHLHRHPISAAPTHRSTAPASRHQVLTFPRREPARRHAPGQAPAHIAVPLRELALLRGRPAPISRASTSGEQNLLRPRPPLWRLQVAPSCPTHLLRRGSFRAAAALVSFVAL